MNNIVGTNVPDPMPEYIGYMYKQFAKDIQRNIKKRVVDSKIYVTPMVDSDSVEVKITHNSLDIKWTMLIQNIRECIKDEANDSQVMRDICKDIMSSYRDYIWHRVFADWKKRKPANSSEVLVAPVPQVND